MKRRLLPALICLVVTAAAASADPLLLYNTGYETAYFISPPSAVPFAPESRDTNWSVAFESGGPASAYATNSTGFPFTAHWMANGPLSAWISPHKTYDPLLSDAVGTYHYMTAFNIDAGLYDPGTASLTMQLAVDNVVTGIWLNGNLVLGYPSWLSGGMMIDPTTPSYAAFQQVHGPVSISNGFIEGPNFLQIDVRNWQQPFEGTLGNIGNPGGLRVEFLGSEIQDKTAGAVPEPASMVLFGSGLAGLAALARRYRKGGNWVLAGGTRSPFAAPRHGPGDREVRVRRDDAIVHGADGAR